MKIAIVTGAHGYIGSVLCKYLKHAKYHVIGIDYEKNILKDRVKYCDEFHNIDFGSFDALVIYQQNPTATIFHLAADSLITSGEQDPYNCFKNNTAKTMDMINYTNPSNKIIFASTAAVYQNSSFIKREDMIPGPINVYGMSKLMVEQMMEKIYLPKSRNFTSFRFFNVIGARGDVGQQRGTHHIVNKLCHAYKNNLPFFIYGQDFNTIDGTCVRDYVHVYDIVRAMIHEDSMERLDIPTNRVYNLASEKGTTILELINVFKNVVGPISYRYENRRSVDPDILVADPSKFIEETEFEYRFKSTDLDKMIESAWRYYNGWI